jgi:hypothetical protein
MTNSYFECHVTMTGDPEIIRPLVEMRRWKFSCIDGDSVFGDGVKCYATRQFNAKMAVELVTKELFGVATFLEGQGCTVIRRKVEQVIYDDRSSKIRCTGGCVECHLDDLK